MEENIVRCNCSPAHAVLFRAPPRGSLPQPWGMIIVHSDYNKLLARLPCVSIRTGEHYSTGEGLGHPSWGGAGGAQAGLPLTSNRERFGLDGFRRWRKHLLGILGHHTGAQLNLTHGSTVVEFSTGTRCAHTQRPGRRRWQRNATTATGNHRRRLTTG